MYCVGCGKTVDSSKDFCSKCGAKLDKTSVTKSFPRKKEVKEVQKVNHFATVGWVLGLISLIFSWTVIIPEMLFFFALPLNIVGLATKKYFPLKAKSAKSGLIMTIIASVISLIVAVALGVVIATLYPELLQDFKV